MKYTNYDYDKSNYPQYDREEICKNRYSIVSDAYWNARNLKSIIEQSYDISSIRRLPNHKEEVIFSLVALACELYMKSLVYSNEERTSIVREHDLYSLFALLSESERIRISTLLGDGGFDKKLSENKVSLGILMK